MKFDEFVKHVAERADISDHSEAERTALAVLQELCDGITGDVAHDLLARLPAQFRLAVIISPAALPLGADEFGERVSRSLDLANEEARTRIRAVFTTLREAVTWAELEDVLAQLDPESADLLA